MTTTTAPAVGATADQQRLGRVAGLLFLVLLVLGPFSIMYVPGQIVVDGDATATGTNVVASEALLRWGIAADVVIFLTEIAMAVVLYQLFRASGRALAQMMLAARVAQAVVMAVNVLGLLVVLVLLSGAGYLTVVGREQLDALALATFEVHEYGGYIGQAFFGLSLCLLGILIHRSLLVPRLLGVLMVIAGAGYLADSLGNFLVPGTSEVFGAIVIGTAMVGELPFFLWLLVRGVQPAEADRPRGMRRIP